MDGGSKEGSLEKYKSVVGSTLALMNPGAHFTSSLVASRLTKTAAKVNGPKQKKYESVYDISYLFQYIAEMDEPDDFKSLTERVILLMKCLTGWRADDLVGVMVDGGVRRNQLGVHLRSWNTKKRKQAWTTWTFIPKKPAEYESICLVNFLDKLLGYHRKENFVAKRVQVDEGRTDVPLFVSATKGERKPLSAATIRTKFQKELLANVRDGAAVDAPSLDVAYKQHSSRHAVASFLAMMRVPDEAIASHMCTTAESIQKTYIVGLHQDWLVPECVRWTNDLATKLVIPYVHYVSTRKAGQVCHCKSLMETFQPPIQGSVPPPSLSNLQSPSSERSGI